MTELDIAQNRKSRKWSRSELLGRLLWAITSPLFRYSPRWFWGWRNMILRLYGAEIAPTARIDPSVRIFIPWNLSLGSYSSIGFDAIVYNLGFVTIEKNVTVSQRTHLCAGTHDYTQPTMPLMKKPITIQTNAWICADAFIGPGVNIGTSAIIGARSVVVRDIPANTIACGNPARVVKPRVPLADSTNKREPLH